MVDLDDFAVYKSKIVLSAFAVHRPQATKTTYILLQLGVLLLGMNEVENDVECACENKGEEQAEAGEVRVALRTVSDESNQGGETSTC